MVKEDAARRDCAVGSGSQGEFLSWSLAQWKRVEERKWRKVEGGRWKVDDGRETRG